MEIKTDILTARKNLRNIYIKYTQELFQITKKIDDYLEVMQTANGED